MRQLGVCASSSASPTLTHGAEMPTNHPVEAFARFRLSTERHGLIRPMFDETVWQP
jgi:hypothetical protein